MSDRLRDFPASGTAASRCERCPQPATRLSSYWHDDGEALPVCEKCEDAVAAAHAIMLVRRAGCEPR